MCDRRSVGDVTIRDLKVLVVVWSANETCFVSLLWRFRVRSMLALSQTAADWQRDIYK
jgi:hypothetical protein